MDNEVFEKLIRLWRQRKDPTEALTPQEIAFHLYGKGSPENATKPCTSYGHSSHISLYHR